KTLSGNYSESKIDMVDSLNRRLNGWRNFYRFVNFKARIFSYVDGVVFWKLAHWLARKYRSGIKPLMRHWFKSPDGTQAKTWVLFGRTNNGHLHGAVLARLVGHSSQGF